MILEFIGKLLGFYHFAPDIVVTIDKHNLKQYKAIEKEWYRENNLYTVLDKKPNKIRDKGCQIHFTCEDNYVGFAWIEKVNHIGRDLNPLRNKSFYLYTGKYAIIYKSPYFLQEPIKYKDLKFGKFKYVKRNKWL